ncbi:MULTISPECIES: hypothetical protein [unclassified Candidatus Cardinium]|uniref:hypothetical protein n=1 Tax=unclassified Candidatus Cardinium TaxID=2641185 RepID=UPI001FB395BF|nr:MULTISPECIES: hypothetical protein [unclassified Candidatus Cardinium]
MKTKKNKTIKILATNFRSLYCAFLVLAGSSFCNPKKEIKSCSSLQQKCESEGVENPSYILDQDEKEEDTTEEKATEEDTTEEEAKAKEVKENANSKHRLEETTSPQANVQPKASRTEQGPVTVEPPIKGSNKSNQSDVVVKNVTSIDTKPGNRLAKPRLDQTNENKKGNNENIITGNQDENREITYNLEVDKGQLTKRKNKSKNKSTSTEDNNENKENKANTKRKIDQVAESSNNSKKTETLQNHSALSCINAPNQLSNGLSSQDIQRDMKHRIKKLKEGIEILIKSIKNLRKNKEVSLILQAIEKELQDLEIVGKTVTIEQELQGIQAALSEIKKKLKPIRKDKNQDISCSS